MILIILGHLFFLKYLFLKISLKIKFFSHIFFLYIKNLINFLTYNLTNQKKIVYLYLVLIN
jgi:hypothetical protein